MQVPNQGRSAPPEALSAVAHPLRWALLYELARSDRQVGELTAILGERQNLVSYHLGRLREVGLVRARRSSQDGRQTYYRADLDVYAELLAGSGLALHPAVALAPSDGAPSLVRAAPARILFLCTGNSARSQMAEALVNHAGEPVARAVSAGEAPRPIHPQAIRAMDARGIDISGQRSKHVRVFDGEVFDYVVTLCDRAREQCPNFMGARMSHWSIADPADAGPGDGESRARFEAAADEIAGRVGYLLRLIAAEAA